MRTIFTTILFFIFCSHYLFAQDAKGESIFNQISSSETITISVNILPYGMELAGKLKDKLLAYPEKVTEVKLNTKQTTLLITYNGNMLREDFIRAFEESGVSHRISNSEISNLPSESN